MSVEAAVTSAQGTPARHPRGLYVLFATEMWERFSFYTMLALFTLYLQDKTEGFGWTDARATTLRANYLLFVFFSPLIGGWLADRKLGYRRAVMIGGVFFMAGHVLLAFPSVEVMYAALVCLVIGNGLFKPNVSTIVGNLYPEGKPPAGPRVQHLLHGHQPRRHDGSDRRRVRPRRSTAFIPPLPSRRAAW